MKTDYPKLRAHLKALDSPLQERFARDCGTTLNYLRKAMSKGSRMDVALVEKIVVNSHFVVPPEELRPDVDWSVFTYEKAMSKISGSRRPAPRADPVPS